MNSPNITHDERVPWLLTTEHILLLAVVLYEHQTIFNVAESGCPFYERTACLLTDLREQCCQGAGAADPFPDMPLSPRFEDEESSATEGSAP
jgi:hypothetical protein